MNTYTVVGIYGDAPCSEEFYVSWVERVIADSPAAAYIVAARKASIRRAQCTTYETRQEFKKTVQYILSLCCGIATFIGWHSDVFDPCNVDFLKNSVTALGHIEEK